MALTDVDQLALRNLKDGVRAQVSNRQTNQRDRGGYLGPSSPDYLHLLGRVDELPAGSEERREVLSVLSSVDRNNY